MKRSSQDLLTENSSQGKRKKCTEVMQCTPFCAEECAFQGRHNNLIIALVGLEESRRKNLEEWKASIIKTKEMRDLNQPLEDPDPDLHYPLLHWAATLGKFKAVKWLLEQEFMDFRTNPVNPVCSQSNVSNETVLFSMVRFLHEGVKTADPHRISKFFLSILDVLLKHDPDVLLVQEGDIKDTVLHLCARGEKGSSAPFSMYLKRILVKLKDVSQKNKRLQLRNIIEKKNKEGDTFIHVISKRNNKEESRKLIDFVKTKVFEVTFFHIKNDKGMTAEEIFNEQELDPELSENHQPSGTSDDDNNGDDEDVEDKDDDGDDDVVVVDDNGDDDDDDNDDDDDDDDVVVVDDDDGDDGDDDSNDDDDDDGDDDDDDDDDDNDNDDDDFGDDDHHHDNDDDDIDDDNELRSSRSLPSASFIIRYDPIAPVLGGEGSTRKCVRAPRPERISHSECNTGNGPAAKSDEKTEDKPNEEIPPLEFPDSTSWNSHHFDDESDSNVLLFVVEEAVENPEKDFYDAQVCSQNQSNTSEGVSNVDALNNAKDGVEQLIQKTEWKLSQERNKLKESRLSLEESEKKMRRLQKEIDVKKAEAQRMEEAVKATEEQLNSYKESLKKLV